MAISHTDRPDCITPLPAAPPRRFPDTSPWRTLPGRMAYVVSRTPRQRWKYPSRTRMAGRHNRRASTKLPHTRIRQGLEETLRASVAHLARLKIHTKLAHCPKLWRRRAQQAADALGMVPDFATWISFSDGRDTHRRWEGRLFLPKPSMALARAFIATVAELWMTLGQVRELGRRLGPPLREQQSSNPEKPSRLIRDRSPTDPWDARAAFAALAARHGVDVNAAEATG